jgi:hypothetical protein
MKKNAQQDECRLLTNKRQSLIHDVVKLTLFLQTLDSGMTIERVVCDRIVPSKTHQSYFWYKTIVG